MAVSLSDAWNDSKIISDSPPQVVSARISRDESPEQDFALKRAEQRAEQRAEYFELIISELQSLRKEESKRSTVYLGMCGILFALLFFYIDKLQCRIKDLSTNVRRMHMMTHRPSPDWQSKMPEAYPWHL